ncbi:MAG: sugar transferase [Actinomycetota bacterium]|nr:sugar transferase [Actinomycetota bacterium]
MRAIRLAIKRALDVAIAGSCLVVLSPLFAAVAVAVTLSMGRPVLFRQTRLGLEGRPFQLYKFRTMTDERDETGALLEDEHRITRVGKILRSTTLDELPELLNVLRGDMSVVGPRPLLPDYDPLYTSDQRRRHGMKPGMAGPVMAMGRNALSWDEKFALDVWYVDHWTLRLDLKILTMSAWKLLKREGISATGHATMPRFEGSGSSKEDPNG